MSYQNQTWIYNPSDQTIYYGSFHPTANLTAHQRLARSVGIHGNTHLIGGSFKSDGSMQFRSESKNLRVAGACDVSDNFLLRSAVMDSFNNGNIISSSSFRRYAFGNF